MFCSVLHFLQKMARFYSHAFYLSNVRQVVDVIDSTLWTGDRHLNLSRLNLTGWTTFPRRFASIDLSHNKLRAVPVIEDGLVTLNLSENCLRRIDADDFCATLQFLDLSRNELREIHGLPPALKELKLCHNPLTFLCDLPTTLETLWCANTQLASLPALPPSLKKLYVSGNKLTALPFLHEGLEIVSVCRNQLTDLTVPSTIRDLWASDNRLSSLTWVSAPNLRSLTLDRNQLTALPATLRECLMLESLHCSDNRLTTLPDLPLLLSGPSDGQKLRVHGNLLSHNLDYLFPIERFVEFVQGRHQEVPDCGKIREVVVEA